MRQHINCITRAARLHGRVWGQPCCLPEVWSYWLSVTSGEQARCDGPKWEEYSSFLWQSCFPCRPLPVCPVYHHVIGICRLLTSLIMFCSRMPGYERVLWHMQAGRLSRFPPNAFAPHLLCFFPCWQLYILSDQHPRKLVTLSLIG